MNNLVGEKLLYVNDSAFTEFQISKKETFKMAGNTVVGLCLSIAIANIFNTITSNILLRKKEFAILKSIGMSNRQMRKMINLEILFYGINSIFYGLIFSIGALYIMYSYMIETNIYAFTLPWKTIAFLIITIYTVIFIAMWNAIRKISNKNIIDEIKNENI